MAFSESWLNELIAKNDIVSVVSSYAELKPKGRRLWACCPLHGEKTPSFSVSPDKQMFYCFGCHAGGTVIQFIMDMERLSFPEAVKYLADRAGMPMPEEVDDRKVQRERAYRDRLYDACRQAARFYMETLLGPDGGPGRAYLSRRGIGGDAVKRFGLGYAAEGWDRLEKHLTAGGFTQRELLDAGLLVQNAQSGRVYDAYRGRIVYPIQAANGRVLGFGARMLGSEPNQPKYINTGDTPIYNKRSHLYGLNQLKGQKLSELIVVEGYMDVIGLYQAGVTNAVASLGTALTQQQAHLIKRYVENVFIAYDGDAAGQTAMIRGLEILAKEGLHVRVIVFPGGMDPDEFVKQEGKDAFDALRDNALSLNAFKLSSMGAGYDLASEDDRERYAKAGCRFIASLEPIERDRYYQQLAKATGYPPEALKAQGSTEKPVESPYLHRSAPGWKNNQNKARPAETERLRAEIALLCAALQSRDAAEEAVGLNAGELLSREAFQTLFNGAVAAYAVGETPNPAAMIAAMGEREDAELASRALREDAVPPDPRKAAADCVRRIRRYDLSAEIQELTQSVSEPGIDPAERTRRLTEIQRLNREMRGL